MPDKNRTAAALAEYLEDEPEDSGYEVAAKRYDDGWRPSLNPIQRDVFNDRKTKYLLIYGPRGTGKTILALHKLVDHCYNNLNALGFIIVRETGQAKDGGAWSKLIEKVLPEWSTGLGISVHGPRTDPETKKPYVWLQNRFGHGSKIVCFSLPVGEHVADRIKGREPTIVLVDEAQTTDDPAYFDSVSQQVGRATGIDWVQQLMYCCNPSGPSHWLYQRFFVDAYDEESGELNPDYGIFFLPISDNIKNLPSDYYDRVLEAVKNDPIERARMLGGEWKDRPVGVAIFKGYFHEELSVKGDAVTGYGILPIPGLVTLVGYDLGPKSTSIHFLQCVPVKDKLVWIVFDELNYVDTFTPYRDIVPKLLERMDYWSGLMQCQFHFDHISDDSAFNQARPDGSLDHMTFEQLSSGRIRMRPAPKGKGSVLERVRMVMEMLQQDELVLSAICVKTKEMFLNLAGDKPGRNYDANAALKPAKSPYLHAFDSMTYPIITVKSGLLSLTMGDTGARVIYLR